VLHRGAEATLGESIQDSVSGEDFEPKELVIA